MNRQNVKGMKRAPNRNLNENYLTYLEVRRGGMTLKAMGEKYGVTIERVRQIVAKCERIERWHEKMKKVESSENEPTRV